MSAEGHSYVCIFVYHCIHAITLGSQVPPSQQPQLHTSSERGGERPLTAPVVELRRRAGSVAAGNVLGCKGPSRMACPKVGAATVGWADCWLAIGIAWTRETFRRCFHVFLLCCLFCWDVRLVISVPLVECRQKACTDTWDGANHSAPLWGQPSDCWSSHCVQTSAEKPNKSERSHVS